MIGDFLRALGQVTDKRFSGVLLRALLLTIALLAALTAGAVGLVGFLPDTFSLPWFGQFQTPFAAVQGLAAGAMLALSAFLMFPVAAMFVNLFLDSIADAVEARHYPGLPAPRRIGWIEALKGGIGFAVVVVVVNILAFGFYLLSGPFAPVLFWLVNGYLLGREFFEMVAQRRVEPPEMRRMRRRHGFAITLAGALMAMPLSIPVVNLVVPLVGVAAFTHMFHRYAGRKPEAAA